MLNSIKFFCIAVLGLCTFASLAQITLPIVPVGNPDNPPDARHAFGDLPNRFGSVPYTFYMGATEVTNAQYTVFLNAVAGVDTYGLYNPDMAFVPGGGIIRTGFPTRTYSVIPGRENHPVTYVSYFDALRFANWLHNGQPTGGQNNATTEGGAYTITASGVTNNSIERNSNWLWAIPTENEWYKAAFHQPSTSPGGPAGNYWYFGTSTDFISPAIAHYGNSVTDSCPVTTYAPNYWGVYGMAGNLWEWNDTNFAPASPLIRGMRGGYRCCDDWNLASIYGRGSNIADNEWQHGTFRIVARNACQTPGAATSIATPSPTLCDRVRITWNPAPNATGYTVFRSNVNNFSTAFQLGSVSSSPFDDLTATPGQPSFYWVRPFSPCGNGPVSVPISAYRPGQITAAPTVNASDWTSCTQVSISWSAVPNAEWYIIYRSLTSNFADAAVFFSAATGTSYPDLTALPNVNYYYFVQGNNTCNVPGPISLANVGSRLGPPQPPTGFAANPTCTAIQLSWNALPNVSEYVLYRHTSDNLSTASFLASTFSPGFSDTTAVAGTRYYYWLRGENGCNPITFSSSVTAQRTARPAIPTGLTATDGTLCSSVNVTWNASPLATTYTVHRATVNNFANATTIATVSQNAYLDTATAGTTQYFYWVRAVNSCGNSAQSSSNSGFASLSAVVTSNPDDLAIYEGETAIFTITSANASSYRWRRNGVNLSDNANISGATTRTLTITAVTPADEGEYRCFITGACDSDLSGIATLTLLPPPCPGDYNQDGGIDGSDIAAFFDDWVAGAPRADTNLDGGIDGSDIDTFFISWSSGSC